MQTDASQPEAVEYFDSHAEYYAQSQYRTTRRTFINGRHDTVVAVLAGLPLAPGARVLDAGCGPGQIVAALATRRVDVSAVDTSPRMLEVAKANVPAELQSFVQYHVGNILALPFPDATFDLVCSTGVIEYIKPYDPVIAELGRVLKPGGVLVLTTTNMLAPAHWFRHVLEPLARVPAVARTLGISPGGYRVWFHYLPKFKRAFARSGLVLSGERHFYLTLPRPLDRLFPSTAWRIERFFDGRMRSWVRHLAEGYVAIASKPGRDVH